MPQNTATISFADAFVSNATKADPSTTSASIDNFDVWAFMDEVGGTVFTDEDVTKSNGAWGYTNTQYWYPGHTYYFAALSPANSANVTETLAAGDAAKLGLGEIAFTNVDGTEDLLYAKAKETTPDAATLANQGMEPVKMQFQHLLSKVKFTFQNGFASNLTTVKVTDVKMTAPKAAKINLAQADYAAAWELSDTEPDFQLAFGDVATTLAATTSDSAADERLTIPADATKEYTVTFKVEVFQGSVSAMESDLTATISGIALEMGKAYNFTAVINQDVLDLKPIEFTATVDEWDTEFQGPVGHYVSTAAELETLANAATEDITIVLGDDLTGDVMLVEKPGVHVTIDGNGHEYDGQIKIHANSTRNTGAVTIKNVKFETANNDVNFIYAVEFETGKRYSQNITVENCTFEAGSLNTTVVGVQVKSSQNLVVKNCTAKNIHSLLQAQSCDADVIVEGCTVEGCKNGVGFKQVKKAVVEGTTITAQAYGIRFDGNVDNYGIVVKNNNITANQPLIVRKMTGKNNTITLEGANTLTTNADPAYQVIITKGSDDEAYVKPTGTYTLTGADNFLVYPPIENYDEFLATISDDTWYDDTKTELAIEDVADFAAFVETVNSGNDFEGKTLKLSGDIDLYFKDITTNADGDPVTFRPIGDTKYNGGKPFKGTFDGQGHTIKNLYQNGWDLGYQWGVYGSYGLFGNLQDATVKNVVLEGSESYIEGGDVSFIAGSATGDCVFENITIKSGTIATYNNGCGGIIGWSGAGNYTFKNIVLESDVVLGGLWGSFDSSIGGIVGQAEPGATYNFENVTINCRIDAYNDCTASYDYYNYRMCGMIIGRCEETTTIDGKNYPDLSKYKLSFNNVVVNYGQWMNYHYCRVSGQRAVRIEPGYAYDGAENRDHSNDDKHCKECIPFDQLIGGDQYAVKGLPAVDGVTVNYPAEYTCPLCGKQHNVK